MQGFHFVLIHALFAVPAFRVIIVIACDMDFDHVSVPYVLLTWKQKSTEELKLA